MWTDSKEKQHGPKESNGLNTGRLDGAAQKSLQFFKQLFEFKSQEFKYFQTKFELDSK
jgi:hypothetical protein